ncbi:translation initiation factor IF6 [Kipferlia bialata]|uniref:Translation initiation factor IF6 n=1 Tax=Kipferlia bialata TaxID=797122 RepID=A0A9K3D0J5_9EUKA|nr:translation initiation factor IF6 [Kipferlia bialata]|eukprot:g7257.t1
MSIRVQYENNSDIGCFAKLTNKYCLVGHAGSENFYSSFEAVLAEHIPVVHTSINGCKVVGRLCAGNRHGLVLPATVTDQEMMHIRNALPEDVVVQRVEERLSALGNVISCNDRYDECLSL